jgi:hypothetical protein
MLEMRLTIEHVKNIISDDDLTRSKHLATLKNSEV